MEKTVLKGLPASPGAYVGQALVARQPTDAIGQSGRVLVLKSSSVDWLEAIIKAGAVVTELGGRTSHAATICREIGKPCVTAVSAITSIIGSGAWVVVDGDSGTVTILP